MFTSFRYRYLLLVLIVTSAFSVQNAGAFVQETPPNISGPFIFSNDSYTLSIYGEYSAGTSQFLCPVEGPYEMSYAHTLDDISYSIQGTGLQGGVNYSGGNGHSGLCGDFEENVYDYSATINISSLPDGQYTVKVSAKNSNSEFIEGSNTFSISRCAAGYGNACTSSANSCGQTNSGTIQCNGSCSASTPANPAGYGNACTSAANACGQTSSGTIQCDGSCSASTPANPAGYGYA